MQLGKRIGWFEEYRCGCVSETATTKKDLLGYCGKHGDDRRQIFPVFAKSKTKEQPTSSVYCCKCSNLIGSVPYDDGPINSITCTSCINILKNTTQE